MKDNLLYWSITLEPSWVQSAIWNIKDDKAFIISVSPTSHWETAEDLITATDASLSSSIQNLPEEFEEPSKTVFGVRSSWVSEGQIAKNYLSLIREICSKLSLVPAGFVVLPEAIAHYLKNQEGSPLSAVIIGISSEEIEVSLFRLGNLSGSTSITRSVSIIDDVLEGLVRLDKTKEVFPSRFIVYNGKEGELEEARQALVEAEWGDIQEAPKFLHVPKVEIIDPEKKMEAVSLAGASEIAEVKGIIELTKSDTNDLEESSLVEEESLQHKEAELGASDVGFAVGVDIRDTQQNLEVKDKPFQVVQKPEIINKGFTKKFKLPNLSKLSEILNNLVNYIKMKVGSIFPKEINFNNRTLMLYILLGLFIAIFLAFFAWWFLPKAKISIFINTQNLEEKESLLVDPNVSGVDFESKTIKGRLVEVKIEGEKTRSTTGTKKVGEKAKGTVKIRNGTSSIINLTTASFLSGTNALRFGLDSSASVSAALSPTEPGTALVGVTAEDIGAEYNLAKNEIFKVGNFPKSDVDAISETDFAGGSSREIPSVSLEDKKLLEEDLTKELEEKSKDKLKDEVSQDEEFIQEIIDSTPSSIEFSHKIGDEASTLKLSMVLNSRSLAIPKKLLNDLATQILKGKIPNGYTLRSEDVIPSFAFVEERNGKFNLDVNFIASLLPSVKVLEIKRSIQGKDSNEVKEYLSTIPGFSRAEVVFSPSLPGILNRIPRISKNINIELTPEK